MSTDFSDGKSYTNAIQMLKGMIKKGDYTDILWSNI